METNESQSDPNSEVLAQLQAMQNGSTPTEVVNASAADVPQSNQASVTDEVNVDGTPAAEPIVLDGQTFANEKEAYAYAQKKLAESETEKMLLQARQEGIESALHLAGQNANGVTPQVVVPPEDDTDLFYTDPKKYMEKKRDEIIQQVRAEQQQTQQEETLWREFFNAHPDLDGFKEDCQDTLNKNIETIKVLAAKDRKRAMDYLATKTREKFEQYMERRKPRTTLSNTKAGPSAGNFSSGVTPALKKDSDEPVDFVSQMRSLSKR